MLAYREVTKPNVKPMWMRSQGIRYQSSVSGLAALRKKHAHPIPALALKNPFHHIKSMIG
jgi:hypothetical protein